MTGDHKNNEYPPPVDMENQVQASESDDSDANMDEMDSEGQPVQTNVGEISEITSLQQERDTLARAASERLELAQRTQAEMDNLRKRTLRDIENAHKYALEKFITELLPVLDSLELGIQASLATTDITTLREGMDLTLKKFSDSLEKFGALVIDPEGEKFNPEKHEAVSMTEAQGIEPGMIIAVLQKGYELNGRLVRPAIVVVAK
jgi:molecular chaperone GrpE